MSMRSDTVSKGWIGRAALLVPVLMAGCVISAQAATELSGSAGEAPVRQVPRHDSRSSLDERIRILSKRLDLDATQQSELRALLEGQRDRVMRVWSDTSLPAAYRISATQAISDKTADRIRALLNEEQRKKFNPPRPARDAAAGSAQPSVEDWMNATEQK